MPKPSPAFVLSVVALFVSLGGTGYAATKIAKGSVGAKQLKANAVTAGKVRNGALRLRHFKASERVKLHGKAGARGLTGPAGTRGLQGLAGAPGLEGDPGVQGDQGLQGGQGATGVAQVVVRTTAFTFALNTGDGQTQSDDVQCQTQETVVGGGTDVSPSVAVNSQPNTIITTSRPADANGDGLGNGGEPTGWFASARRNSQGATQTVTVYVLCASSA